MLALRTGWTMQTIGGDGPGGISAEFREAAHFALYAEAIAPLLHDATDAASMSTKDVRDPKRLAAISLVRIQGEKQRDSLRHLLMLDDDGG